MTLPTHRIAGRGPRGTTRPVTAASPARTETGAEPRHVAVLVSLFLLLTVSAGCTNYNLPLYLQHLTKDRGLSLSGVSFGTTVFFICGALVALPIGRLLMRVQPRLIMAVGGLVGGVALVFLGQAHQLWHAYLCYGVMGAAFSAGGALPASTAVLRISTRAQRAGMLSAATAGVSAGGFVVSPISSVLLSDVGLSTGLLILGCAYAAISVAVMALLMPKVPIPEPAASAQVITADRTAAVASEADDEVDVSLAAAIRTSTFWLIAACLVLNYLGQIGSTNHIIRMASDRDLGNLGLILPVVTIFALAGRLIGSVALRRYSIWTVLVCVLMVEIVATAGLAFTDSTAALFVNGALVGIVIGHTPVAQTITFVDAFGARDFPRIASVMTVLGSIGLGGGPVLVSIVHNSTSGTWGLYRAGYLTLTATSVLGCGLAIALAVRFSSAARR
jgi:Major Facilitator Superfamily